MLLADILPLHTFLLNFVGVLWHFNSECLPDKTAELRWESNSGC